MENIKITITSLYLDYTAKTKCVSYTLMFFEDAIQLEFWATATICFMSKFFQENEMESAKVLLQNLNNSDGSLKNAESVFEGFGYLEFHYWNEKERILTDTPENAANYALRY